MRLRNSLILAVLVLGFPSVASAHAVLQSPTPRSPADGLKTGPCGNIAPTSSVTELVIGEVYTIAWAETIDHTGYYTISIDPTPESDDQVEFDANVWEPNFADVQGGQLPHTYSFDYTIPNTPCNPCTMQMRQWMEGAQSFYYSCADIAIVTEASQPTPTPGDDDDDDNGAGADVGASGCSCAIGAPGVPATGVSLLLLGAALIGWRIRRPRAH